MFRRLLCTLALCIGLSACSPTIDTSSTAALVASVAKIQTTLDAQQRDKFNKSLLTVAFSDATDASALDLVTHADRILPEAKAAINGKSASQIIAQAKRIERRR